MEEGVVRRTFFPSRSLRNRSVVFWLVDAAVMTSSVRKIYENLNACRGWWLEGLLVRMFVCASVCLEVLDVRLSLSTWRTPLLPVVKRFDKVICDTNNVETVSRNP